MIGIFGGTFNPIHYGHLRPALEVLQAHPLEQIRFIPLNIAVHRQQPKIDIKYRLEMLEAAVINQASFIIDKRELMINKPSYTIDTLKNLHQEFSNQSFCLIIGMDSFLSFAQWQAPEKILKLAHLMVMSRPDYLLTKKNPYFKRITKNKKNLETQPAGKIFIQPVTPLAISSSQIRQLIQNNQSLDYLLPPRCIEIIKANQLYQNN